MDDDPTDPSIPIEEDPAVDIYTPYGIVVVWTTIPGAGARITQTNHEAVLRAVHALRPSYYLDGQETTEELAAALRWPLHYCERIDR